MFTTVSIEMPANEYNAATNPLGFVPIIVNIPPNTTERVELWGNNLCDPNNSSVRKAVENRIDDVDPAKILNKGMHITATNFVTVYYEVEETNNSDIFALKGVNALGDEFFVPFQTHSYNHNFTNQPAISAIDFVAVDPGNTTVWVYPTKPVVGHGTDSFAVVLKQGESYTLIPGYVDGGTGDYIYDRDGADHLAGTRLRVVGGKRIAVTISDDSVHGDNGCYDLIGDQLVPIESIDDEGNREPIIGEEYIIMKGKLRANERDRIFILATEANTTIAVTDVSGGGTTTYNNVNASEQIEHTISNTALITHVKSTSGKPVYVLHVTGAGGGCEIGEQCCQRLANVQVHLMWAFHVAMILAKSSS
ncbi:MAG: hypothetical protein HC896_15010 [Bacteroidales bacterium]|nr:hypothetical protein [Bacteroidales bacterium]